MTSLPSVERISDFVTVAQNAGLKIVLENHKLSETSSDHLREILDYFVKSYDAFVIY